MNVQDKANRFRPENIMTNTGIPQIHRFSHLTLEKTSNASGSPYHHAVQTAALPQEYALHLTPAFQRSC